ncbi:MAG: hypothetical protein M3462_14140 [Chloroflexota bacterium]|nr:hypothetical protein [Chloroflexota bacterium]
MTGGRAPRLVADLLRATCRRGDLLVRYGGDEFPRDPAGAPIRRAHSVPAPVRPRPTRDPRRP